MQNLWLILYLASFFFIANCSETHKKAKNSYSNPSLNYSLERATQAHSLHHVLIEISALSFNEDGNLYSLNDEQGIIYVLDKSSGSILDEIPFAGPGDYEGIEVVGDKVYAINSSGLIYQFDKRSQQTEIIRTPLSHLNNVEGLGFYPDEQLLLIALKGSGSLRTKYAAYKSIYSYNLESKTFNEEPFIKLNVDSLKNLYPEMSHRVKELAPSGIAFNTYTEEFYVISSKGKLLLRLNKKKELIDIQFLDKNLYRQPEGICFDSDNKLYISNEGQHAKASLLMFDKEK